MLETMDLNLLRVFDALMRERKVAAAALRLQLSAPAMSNALARLRRTLGDELFTRTPQGMQPTPYAQQLAESIGGALALLDAGLARRAAFDPATSTRRFRLAMTDIGEMHFVPALMGELQRHAPGVQLATVRHTTIALRDEMAEGTVDLAVGWLPRLKAGFHQRRLFDQRYLALMAATNPLARGKLTLERFVRARHVVVQAEGTGHERVDALLRRAGAARAVSLEMPHFLAAPFVVSNSDLVAIVPEVLARRTAPALKLVARELPVALPIFEVNLFWHRRVHQDGGNRWVRERIAAAFASPG